MLNTVGTIVGTPHTTVSTPRGYQHFPVTEDMALDYILKIHSSTIITRRGGGILAFAAADFMFTMMHAIVNIRFQQRYLLG